MQVCVSKCESEVNFNVEILNVSVSPVLSFAAQVISQGGPKPLSAYRAQGQI